MRTHYCENDQYELTNLETSLLQCIENYGPEVGIYTFKDFGFDGQNLTDEQKNEKVMKMLAVIATKLHKSKIASVHFFCRSSDTPKPHRWYTLERIGDTAMVEVFRHTKHEYLDAKVDIERGPVLLFNRDDFGTLETFNDKCEVLKLFFNTQFGHAADKPKIESLEHN